MLLRIGLLFACIAVFFQIAVFLQPLLPKQYQVAPVCETITRALLQSTTMQHAQHSVASDHSTFKSSLSSHTEHDHDIGHQCQYCTVYGNLVLPPDLAVKEVLDRIQVRLLAFQKSCAYVWFVLQRLFLLPQGRAPPLFV
ncbi:MULTISPECIES: DUF2946 domain-containing protein [unclassified Acinetobacter]|uniref:DUF2946 domain-containing protein n=1 Tax=unclassified Acinetobacter TaxID=196816 RepID=UPI0029341173|nr:MULTISPECIES: DUF2946 domain-containing protein [unclassified Acinetobacter]WOE30710.1 DUF2946 domain-containing protein [Acinetobacter sp. SAAs470]WOE38903.1 DUF2946 domain-containing protein [Acinetobacter sp. SAAs474]